MACGYHTNGFLEYREPWAQSPLAITRASPPLR